MQEAISLELRKRVLLQQVPEMTIHYSESTDRTYFTRGSAKFWCGTIGSAAYTGIEKDVTCKRCLKKLGHT
jgi:hypothetical protein